MNRPVTYVEVKRAGQRAAGPDYPDALARAAEVIRC
jgi:hypothetical protein